MLVGVLSPAPDILAGELVKAVPVTFEPEPTEKEKLFSVLTLSPVVEVIWLPVFVVPSKTAEPVAVLPAKLTSML